MASACLVLFCGLPGAGKSTTARKLLDILANPSPKTDFLFLKDNNYVDTDAEEQKSNETLSILNDCHVLYICFDDIIPDNLYTDIDTANGHKSSPEKTWKGFRACIAEFLDEFLNMHCNLTRQSDFLENDLFGMSEEWDYVYSRIEEDKFCNCRGSVIQKHRRCDCGVKHIILLDDNMFYSSMRYRYYQMARKYSTGFLQIYISCDEEGLVKQNSERAAAVSLQTIEHMSSVFEAPDPQRNGWENNLIEISSTNSDIQSKLYDVLIMIADSLQSPVTSFEKENIVAKDEAREINLKSILHQTDQVLRKFIASCMKEQQGLKVSKERLQAESSSLNTRKKSFMDALKRSNETLKSLDGLLFHQHQSVLKTTVSGGGDVGLIDTDILTPEHMATSSGIVSHSQSLHSKERFSFTVANLFQRFNTDVLP